MSDQFGIQVIYNFILKLFEVFIAAFFPYHSLHEYISSVLIPLRLLTFLLRFEDKIYYVFNTRYVLVSIYLSKADNTAFMVPHISILPSNTMFSDARIRIHALCIISNYKIFYKEL